MNFPAFGCFTFIFMVNCDAIVDEIKLDIDDTFSTNLNSTKDDTFSDEYVVDMDIQHLMKAENKTIEDLENFNENELGFSDINEFCNEISSFLLCVVCIHFILSLKSENEINNSENHHSRKHKIFVILGVSLFVIIVLIVVIVFICKRFCKKIKITEQIICTKFCGKTNSTIEQ